MEGDIRSSSSEDISDNSIDSTPLNNSTNYVTKQNSRQKVQ